MKANQGAPYPTVVEVLRVLRACPQGVSTEELLHRLPDLEPERVGQVLDRLAAVGVLQVSGEELRPLAGLPELADKMSRLYRTLKEEGQVRDLVRLILRPTR